MRLQGVRSSATNPNGRTPAQRSLPLPLQGAHQAGLCLLLRVLPEAFPASKWSRGRARDGTVVITAGVGWGSGSAKVKTTSHRSSPPLPPPHSNTHTPPLSCPLNRAPATACGRSTTGGFGNGSCPSLKSVPARVWEKRKAFDMKQHGCVQPAGTPREVRLYVPSSI